MCGECWERGRKENLKVVKTVGVLTPDLRGPEDTLLLEILQKVSGDVDLLQKQAHVVAQILVQSQRLIFTHR